MSANHNINSPAPGSIDLDHNIPVDCCECNERPATPLVVVTLDDPCEYLTTEQLDSPTTTNSSVFSLVIPPSPSSTEKVNLAIEEIISSEQRFISQLNRLVNIYMPRLCALFMDSEIPPLIRNIQEILEAHTSLVDGFKKNRKNRSALCDIIVSYAPELTALHSEFWAGHSGAKALLNKARSRNSQRWSLWEKERAAECPPEEDGSLPRTFEDLMIAPIWRVFTYHFLVGGLRDTSGNGQVDVAVRAMQSVAASVDNAGRLHEGEAYTKFILGRMKPVEDLNPGFLSSLGPCIRIGALQVVYREYSTPPKASHESLNSLPPHTPSVIAFPQESSWNIPPKSMKYKQLAILLWKGYLVLCKVNDNKMEYEPERWFPLRVDPDIEPTSSVVSLGTSRSVEVISSDMIFPHGIRIAFGRHVFELGAPCAVDRDEWLWDISSARVNSEKGNELVSRASIRRGRGEHFQPAKQKGVNEVSPVTTVKGFAKVLSDGSWRPWRKSRNFSAGKLDAAATSVQPELKNLGKAESTSSTTSPDTSSRRPVANHLSSKDVFGQLVAHGCTDLSSSMNPNKYSDRSIAGGAFADIWKGALRDGTEVAIKVWRFDDIDISEDGPKKLKRAMREVYHWSKVRHSHIQELLGVVLFKGRVGMVSPWRKYGNLRDYIKKHENIDRHDLCLQVANGLSYLHDRNMVHGDLKACNILVSEDGKIKLSDFDHSILSDCTLAFSDTTNFGGGTLRWMAPELVIPEDEKTPCRRNKRTDVYSLAMTFLEILTAQVPYADRSHEGAIFQAKAKKQHPNRPQELLGSEQNETIWNLLVQCWNHDPLARPNATEVLEKVSFGSKTRDWRQLIGIEQLEKLLG